MPQRGKSSEKRARILRAAIKVFAAKGYYSARVMDVASEAGVADGTIYLYFEGKEDLLRGLYDENMGRIIEGLKAIVRGPGDPVSRLVHVFEAYGEFAESDPALAEVLTVEIRESGKFMNEFAAPLFGELLRIIEAIVEEGQEAGQLRSNFSARNVTRALFGAMDELALAWVMGGRRWDLKKSGKEVLEVFLIGMGNQSQPVPAIGVE